MGCGTSRPPVVSTAHQPQAQPKPKLQQENKPGQGIAQQENQRIEQNETQKETKPEQQPQHDYIDSSEFHPLSYEEVAALRPSDPENMWAIVKKTCDRNKEWKLDSVKNRRGWKTIRLFVSSTFRDFHAEREALVKEVGLCLHLNLSVENDIPEIRYFIHLAVHNRRDLEELSVNTPFDVPAFNVMSYKYYINVQLQMFYLLNICFIFAYKLK